MYVILSMSKLPDGNKLVLAKASMLISPGVAKKCLVIYVWVYTKRGGVARHEEYFNEHDEDRAIKAFNIRSESKDATKLSGTGMDIYDLRE